MLDQISVYDKPGILAAQVLEGEFTLRGLKNLALNPDGLSLEERTDLGDMLRGETPVNSVQETLYSTLTNPFVWMYFVTSPAGAQVAKKGVSLFGATAAQRAAEMAKKQPGIMQSLSLLTRNQASYYSNTMRSVTRRVTNSLDEMEMVRAELVGMDGDAVKRVAKSAGLHKGLDPQLYAEGSIERIKAERITRAVYARARGYHIDGDAVTRAEGKSTWLHRVGDDAVEVTDIDEANRIRREIADKRLAYKDARQVHQARVNIYQRRLKAWAKNPQGPAPTRPPEFDLPAVNEEIYTKPVISTTTEFREAMLDKDRLLSVFDEVDGLEDLYWANQEGTRDAIVRVLGKDGAGVEKFIDDRGVERVRTRLELDEGKLKKIARSFRSELWSEKDLLIKDAETYEGRAMMARIVDPDILKGIEAGVIAEDDFVDMMRRTYEPVTRGESYLPLNTLEGIDLPGAQASTDYVKAMNNYGQNIPLSGSLTPATQAEHLWDPDDLRAMMDEFGGNDRFEEFMELNEVRLMERSNAGLETAVLKSDGWKAWDSYRRDMDQTYSIHVRDLDDATKNAWKQESGELAEAIANKQFTPEPGIRYGSDLPEGATAADAIGWSYGAQLDPHSKKSYAHTFLPFLLHRQHDIRHAVTTGQFYEAKRGISSIAQTRPLQALKKTKHGRRFVEELERLGDPNAKAPGGVGLAGPAANMLYVSHLGLNLGSMVLNATQPFLLAGTAVGARHVIKGYGAALREMFEYGVDRYQTYGVRRISSAERNVLIKKHFKWADESGIAATTQELLDNVENRGRFKKDGKLEHFLVDLPLKGFEKTEWLNRSVAAHATESLFESSGRKFSRTQISNNVQSLVEETQFGMTEGNTPEIFLNNRLLNNPLMRQFLGFQLRSFTSLIHTMPRLAGGTRYVPQVSPLRLFGIEEISGTLPVLANDIMRGMGLSAILYELSKGLLGADMSRGLFFESSTELLGVGAFTDPNEDLIPIPPIIDIPVDLMRAYSNDDVTLMRMTTARLFPGGVGISRLLGAAPDTGLPLQRRSIGWDEPLEDGSVPVYDWDGKLIKYARPEDVILAGVGADLGRMQQSGGVDRFLMGNRDEIVKARQAYMRAMAANDPGEAEKIAKMFERRFGLPLTVTQDQWDSFQKVREVPRTERILDRIDPNLRERYAAQLQLTDSQTLPIDVTSGPTAATRRQLTEERNGGAEPFSAFSSFQNF